MVEYEAETTLEFLSEFPCHWERGSRIVEDITYQVKAEYLSGYRGTIDHEGCNDNVGNLCTLSIGEIEIAR